LIGKIAKYRGAKGIINRLGMPRAHIEDVQARKLQRLVAHAYDTVPYYRNLFKCHGLEPYDIKNLGDLVKIPVTRRSDLLTLDINEITSSKFKAEQLVTIRTSGTTGEPFIFHSDKSYGRYATESMLASKMLHGMGLMSRNFKLSSMHFKRPDNPLRHFVLSTAALDPINDPSGSLEFYEKYRPHVVRGYISQLYFFSLWLAEQGITLTHKPDFVMTSGETAHGLMRERVSEAFVAKVVDRYATAELGVVGVECPAGGEGYHVFEDGVILETIKKDGKIHLIGTNLENLATPFIRYNTSDLCGGLTAPVEPCSCGLNTSIISVITGRDNDIIHTPTGRQVPPMNLVLRMREYYPYIKQFRYVQNGPRTVSLEIVSRGAFDASIYGPVVERFRKLTGGEMSLTVVEVNSIPLERSGKMRVVIRLDNAEAN
jgi:phenylacetate-CoA ligase